LALTRMAILLTTPSRRVGFENETLGILGVSAVNHSLPNSVRPPGLLI
jgi:hypothetical protein